MRDIHGNLTKWECNHPERAGAVPENHFDPEKQQTAWEDLAAWLEGNG